MANMTPERRITASEIVKKNVPGRGLSHAHFQKQRSGVVSGHSSSALHEVPVLKDALVTSKPASEEMLGAISTAGPSGLGGELSDEDSAKIVDHSRIDSSFSALDSFIAIRLPGEPIPSGMIHWKHALALSILVGFALCGPVGLIIALTIPVAPLYPGSPLQ